MIFLLANVINFYIHVQTLEVFGLEPFLGTSHKYWHKIKSQINDVIVLYGLATESAIFNHSYIVSRVYVGIVVSFK